MEKTEVESDKDRAKNKQRKKRVWRARPQEAPVRKKQAWRAALQRKQPHLLHTHARGMVPQLLHSAAISQFSAFQVFLYAWASRTFPMHPP